MSASRACEGLVAAGNCSIRAGLPCASQYRSSIIWTENGAYPLIVKNGRDPFFKIFAEGVKDASTLNGR